VSLSLTECEDRGVLTLGQKNSSKQTMCCPAMPQQNVMQ